uniref:Uncharacterized protein n=1 Tax=Glossina austeni TaxID=7395 RepID=A0A1A9V0T4_GLOAU
MTDVEISEDIINFSRNGHGIRGFILVPLPSILKIPFFSLRILSSSPEKQRRQELHGLIDDKIYDLLDADSEIIDMDNEEEHFRSRCGGEKEFSNSEDECEEGDQNA